MLSFASDRHRPDRDMNNIKAHLSVLINLAKIDGDFSGEERGMVYMIGKVNQVSREEIQELLENPEPLPPLEVLSSNERFDYLYNLVQLMKIDKEIYTTEIQFCEEMAEKLGYNKRVIGKLSTRIYADPTITADRTQLEKLVQKYDNEQ